MYVGDTIYEYTYKINNDILEIDYKNEEVHDATYTYKLEGDELELIGGEGTIGGEYTLKKE